MLLKDRARLRLAIIGRIMMRLALLLQLLVCRIVALVVIALLLFPAEANKTLK